MTNVGIVGCGMITRLRHAPEYRENGSARMVAWYDALPDRAAEMAAIYGGEVYSDWKRMIREGGCDAVSVCTPNATHAEIAVYALERGLHVLCEKPMATTLSDCARMTDAAKTAGRLLFVGQNQRFHPVHIKARELIRSGAIGRPLTFRTAFAHSGPELWTKTAKTWFYDRAQAAFGAIFDLGIHKLDLMQYLLDEPFVQVSAMLGTLDKKMADGSLIPVDDNACVLLCARSGVMGQMTASWTHYGGEDNASRICGDRGVLHIFEEEDRPLFLTTPEGRTDFAGLGGMQTNDHQFSSGVIDAFMAEIGKGEPFASGDDVYAAMRAVFGAIHSADTGRLVNLEGWAEA